MRPFAFQSVATPADAVAAARSGGASQPHADLDSAYLAGGTTLIDLMKLDVMRPARLIDINRLAPALSQIRVEGDRLQLGALARMSDVASHPDVARRAPVLAQSLLLAASDQLRNMASLGGNVLQRTRCTYFRDMSWTACNKRNPGSGCAALDGVNRSHAILGVSDHCIAAYAGDFGQALIALDATVELQSAQGKRSLPFAQLHRPPGDTPQREHHLQPGELITGFSVALQPWMRRSLYLKVRDRQSYAFALASAAVALDLDGARVKAARIALGGISAVPWRTHAAEKTLVGNTLEPATIDAAARAAIDGARTQAGNAFKIELAQRTLRRALLAAQAMDI